MSNKKYHDEGWLREQYFELGKNGMTIADEQDVHYSTIYDWMERHGGDKYDNIFIILCKSCHGNTFSFWHNSTIGGEPVTELA